MLCEHANPQLVEYAEGSLDAAVRLDIEQHLATCTLCQEDFAAMTGWQTMAAHWYDEIPPAWRPPKVAGPELWETFRQWFPVMASSAALVLVAVMYTQQQQPGGTLPSGQPVNYDALPQLPQATQAAVVDSVMQSSRAQRQEELSALLEILTAEMNRRSIETEDSMRFLIRSQLEGQKELDQLYQQVEQLVQQTHPQTAEPTP